MGGELHLEPGLGAGRGLSETGAPCPAKPKCPEVRVRPLKVSAGYMKVFGSTVARSVSTMTVPLSSTLIAGPLTVTCWKFQTPGARR